MTGFQIRTEMQRPRSQLDFGKQGASQTADQVGGLQETQEIGRATNTRVRCPWCPQLALINLVPGAN